MKYKDKRVLLDLECYNIRLYTGDYETIKKYANRTGSTAAEQIREIVNKYALFCKAQLAGKNDDRRNQIIDHGIGPKKPT